MMRILSLSAAAALLIGATGAEAAPLAEAISQDERFGTLAQAVEAAGVTFEDDAAITVFAPTDEAFAQLPPGTLEFLLAPANGEALTALLQHHVVTETLRAEDLQGRELLEPAAGEALVVATTENIVRIGDATVVEADIAVDEGVVHAIDEVLISEAVLGAMHSPEAYGNAAQDHGSGN